MAAAWATTPSRAAARRGAERPVVGADLDVVGSVLAVPGAKLSEHPVGVGGEHLIDPDRPVGGVNGSGVQPRLTFRFGARLPPAQHKKVHGHAGACGWTCPPGCRSGRIG